MIKISKNDNDYTKWLCDLVDFGRISGYSKLANLLQSTDFVYDIAYNDDLRESDGLALRDEYLHEMKKNYKIEGYCSVLEMLVALSRRFDDICCGLSDTPRFNKWFWVFIINLKLNRFEDAIFDKEAVTNILETWMYRQYDKNGDGSIFKIKNKKVDMRYISIAEQAQRYLIERDYSL